MSKLSMVALASLLAHGCAFDEMEIEDERAAIDDEPGSGEDCLPTCGPDGFGSPTTVTGVSLAGREVFDDWRDFGRFGLREDASGVAGVHYTLNPNSGTSNLLGLREAAISVYEVDRAFDPAETECQDKLKVGSATVASDGTWSVSLASVTDSCSSDDDLAGKIRLAVKVRLTFCDSVRCFSVVNPGTLTQNADMPVWGLYQPTASPTSPWSAGTGASISFPTHVFRDTSAQDAGDASEEAVWIFAGLVDETRKLHVQNNWPFELASFGTVFARYPAAVGNSGTTGGTTISMMAGQLKNGWVPLHEYGHIVHQRLTTATVGSAGNDRLPCGNDFTVPTTDPAFVSDTATECDSWSRTGEFEFDEKAWIEGFADFIAHVTLDTVTASETPYPVGCSLSSYDVNDSAAGPVGGSIHDGANRRRIFGCGTSPGTCQNGSDYPTNVARALCDWYDTGNDDDPQRGGGGDLLTHNLDAMASELKAAYAADANLATGGFTVCDLLAFHVSGQSSTFVDNHEDLIANNGFSCGL